MSEQFVALLKKIWQVLSFSVKIGGNDINLLLIIQVIVVLVVGLVVAKQLRKFLAARLTKTRLDESVQYTILQFIHYSIVVIIFYQAIRLLNIDLTGLAFFAGILSVGIGFGLQSIANNFVSGIILMFERPIKVGDMIAVGDSEGRVQDIKMRATTVATRDNVSVIVPNSQFISGEVTNWSHRDPKVRVHIPVGVAYGSDVQLVTELLLKVAQDHPQVMEEPAPNLWFTSFGDSSLNFDLLAWVANPILRKQIISDLNYAIDAAFRENDVTIPFPQRDLHLHSLPPAKEWESVPKWNLPT